MTCICASRFRRRFSCRRKQSSRAGSNLDREEEEEQEEDSRQEVVRCGGYKLDLAVQ